MAVTKTSLLLLLAVAFCNGSNLKLNVLKAEENSFEYEIMGLDGMPKVHGWSGINLPTALGYWNVDEPCTDVMCLKWGDYASLKLKAAHDDNCYRLEWTSSFARDIRDCFELENNVHWYGGGMIWDQEWPIEGKNRDDNPYLAEGGIAERYWLLSNGASLVVDTDAPLYLSVNVTEKKFCVRAKDQEPYTKRSPLTFGYEWCIAADVKLAHLQVMNYFFDKPMDLPDERMLIQPLWSTWAEYKVDVNQTNTLDYARKVMSYGFVNSSHVEIDDDWETCYGQSEWNQDKFPSPKDMVDEIHEMGMRVTLWTHPFVNYECELFKEGMEKGYFVKNAKGKTGITSWWQGANSGIVDATNPEAVEWWSARLWKIMEETGMDSWKFDAGEVGLLPASPIMEGEERLWPKIYTEKYIEACAAFGGLIETRTASMNQKQPMFFRMGDKDSRWGYDNGLRTLIPTALQLGLNGYPFVLPDMIGGNNYHGEEVTQELFVRWMQVNAFMPGVQFSLVPWNIGRDDAEKQGTVDFCLDVLRIREKYADKILEAARQSLVDGSPINRALWWVDPTDRETFTIDDEYMMGDSILVAPVTYEGQTSRDIYLPSGTWVDEQNSSVHIGPVWLRDYPAPISVVPIFVKTN